MLLPRREAVPEPGHAALKCLDERVGRLQRHPGLDQGLDLDPVQLELAVLLVVVAAIWCAELRHERINNGCGALARIQPVLEADDVHAAEPGEVGLEGLVPEKRWGELTGSVIVVVGCSSS